MIKVDEERCIGCGACIDACSFGAISMVSGKARIDQENCRSCMICARYCGEGAIISVKKSEKNIIAEAETKFREAMEGIKAGDRNCRKLEELEEIIISLKAECYGEHLKDGQGYHGRSGAGYGSGRGYGRWR